MKCKELLDIANKGYPDGFLSEYYDDQGNSKDGFGDGLAKFVVVELIETFSPDQDDAEQVSVAVHCLENAVQELQAIIEALNKRERR